MANIKKEYKLKTTQEDKLMELSVVMNELSDATKRASELVDKYNTLVREIQINPPSIEFID